MVNYVNLGDISDKEVSMERDEDIQVFLRNITLLRKSRGLSKKEMAKKLRIGVWSLNKIERGELPPRLGADVFLAVYRNFGIYPSALFDPRMGQCDTAET